MGCFHGAVVAADVGLGVGAPLTSIGLNSLHRTARRGPIVCVVAIDSRGAIGRNGAMPWRLPADLAHFKSLTMGAPIVMGRVTYESIGRPLPGRQNIVVSRNQDLRLSDVDVVHDLADLLQSHGDGPLFVIGGGQIYREAMPLADRLVVTHVQTTVEDADTFFELPDASMWESIGRVDRAADDRNAHTLTFEVYQRRWA